jgi:hypothetical protein
MNRLQKLDSPWRMLYESFFLVSLTLVDSNNYQVFGGTSSAMVNKVHEEQGCPHFGHWLETNWPNRSEISRVNGGPILSIGKLNSFEIKVPIEVSFYEDMQQTEFWVSGSQPCYINFLTLCFRILV